MFSSAWIEQINRDTSIFMGSLSECIQHTFGISKDTSRHLVNLQHCRTWMPASFLSSASVSPCENIWILRVPTLDNWPWTSSICKSCCTQNLRFSNLGAETVNPLRSKESSICRTWRLGVLSSKNCSLNIDSSDSSKSVSASIRNTSKAPFGLPHIQLVRLLFSAGTVFFSHNNSTGRVFSASFSQVSYQRTGLHYHLLIQCLVSHC